MIKNVAFALLLFTLINGNVQAFTFKIATLSPDGSIWMQKMRQGAKEIANKTENRVKFKFYPGGVMGDDSGVLRKIRFRQLHGAAITNAGLSKIYPDIQLYNMVLKFNSMEEIDYVRERMDAQLMAGLEEKGIVNFGFAEFGLAYLMSTMPINSLSDLKHQKTWVPANNNIALAAMEAFLVSPIPLPLRDVLMGLQTGMLNVVTGSPVGALALQWQTKLKYATNLPLSYIFGVLILDKKAFDKISATDKKIVREVLTRVVNEMDKQSRLDNINAIKALKNQGLEFIDPSQKATNELRQVIKGVNEQLVKTGTLSKQMVDHLNKYLAEYRAQ